MKSTTTNTDTPEFNYCGLPFSEKEYQEAKKSNKIRLIACAILAVVGFSISLAIPSDDKIIHGNRPLSGPKIGMCLVSFLVAATWAGLTMKLPNCRVYKSTIYRKYEKHRILTGVK